MALRFPTDWTSPAALNIGQIPDKNLRCVAISMNNFQSFNGNRKVHVDLKKNPLTFAQKNAQTLENLSLQCPCVAAERKLKLSSVGPTPKCFVKIQMPVERQASYAVMKARHRVSEAFKRLDRVASAG